MEQEIWKDIPGYKGLYQVSNLGRVKALPKLVGRGKRYHASEKFIKLQKTQNGYMIATLSRDGNKNRFLVHRLVAIVFIDNPLDLPFINHKNEIKTDNRVENLEWCTAKYNSNYGARNQKISAAKVGHEVSKETREKLSKMNKGELHPMFGKKRSPETCKRISDGVKMHYANRLG